MPSDYKIIYNGDTDRLARMVKSAMLDGWLPLGGVAVMGYGGGSSFYQAMVLPDVVTTSPPE